MFILNVVLRGRDLPIIMHFQTVEGAEDACAKTQPWISNKDMVGPYDVCVEDGFGHIVRLNRADVAASFVTDVEKDCEAQIRCQMIGQRAQAELQMKLASDPAMKVRGLIRGQG